MSKKKETHHPGVPLGESPSCYKKGYDVIYIVQLVDNEDTMWAFVDKEQAEEFVKQDPDYLCMYPVHMYKYRV